MGTVLVKDVLHRISASLGDLNPQFITFPERNLVDCLNDGQRTIGKFLPFALSRTDVVKMAAGTRQNVAKVLAADIKPGDGSTAQDTYGIRLIDVVRNMGMDGLTQGPAINDVPRETLDAFNPSWQTSTSASPVYFSFDPRNPLAFYLAPGFMYASWVEIVWQANPYTIPNTGTPGIESYGCSGNSTTTISIADEYVDDLVSYVLARMWMDNPEKASSVANAEHQFITSINVQVLNATGQNPNLKSLPLSPAYPASAQ